MSLRMTTLTLSLVVVLGACSDGSGSPSRVVAPDEAQLAKPSGPTDPTATFYIPLADAALGLRSDGRFGDGTYSAYADGVCAVQGRIFATTQGSNSGDATLQTSTPWTKQKTCAARKVTVDYGDGTVWSGGTFMNVKTIANTTYSIPIGTTVPRFLLMDEVRCSGLRWRPVLNDGTVTGADEVLVTRVDASTWRVQSQPYPANKAYCINTGQLFHIAVDFTVGSSYPLP